MLFPALPILASGLQIVEPPLFWVIPFVVLLLSIAAGPLVAPKWWSHKYPLVALPLGLLVVVYYVFIFDNPLRMWISAHEYISFIALVGSLYVVSGGIHFSFAGGLTPHQNLGFLVTGAVIANIVGTTGAAMMLIRPFIRGNQWRWKPYHIVFFIFIVANCGGALTPIGDPPLFLGYLKGVPFFWVVQALWYKWAVAIAILLAIYYYIDRKDFKSQPHRLREAAERPDRLRADGLTNLVFIAVIIAAVFIERPLFLREFLMIAAAAGSYFLTPSRLHRLNEFNWHPVQEVAILFAGIFTTMVPALDWLTVNSRELGMEGVAGYYWGTGVLSAFLDNAPTYLNFLTAAMGSSGLSVENVEHVRAFVVEHSDLLRGISISAVFFGAATYIGNGPNFMCKAIADHANVETPSFIVYIYKYALPYLTPVLILTFFWL